MHSIYIYTYYTYSYSNNVYIYICIYCRLHVSFSLYLSCFMFIPKDKNDQSKHIHGFSLPL